MSARTVVRAGWAGLLVLIAAFAAPRVHAATADEPGASIVVRVHYDEEDDLRSLADYDVWEFNDREQRYVLVQVDPADVRRIESLGFTVERDDERTAELYPDREISPLGGGIPGFPCYRTVEETFATAEQIVADHPTLATWTDVGNSWEKAKGLGGYDLMVLRLTNSAVPGPKPKLFISSSIHAREYTPAELSTRFAEYLVDNYGVDADATWLLDWHEIHLMLQANPDGRKHAEAGQSWRKNTDQQYCGATSTTRGADLNRNFAFQWACCGGSSTDPCNLTYHGAAAASEPETLAIQSYLVAQFPDQRADPLGAPAPLDATGLYLDTHSFSQLVLWPWGFPGPAPNQVQLRTLGRKFAYFNGYTPQQAVDLYTTDGTTLDFAYGQLGVASYTFEIGTAFFQSCSNFQNVIVPAHLPAYVYAAKVARTPYGTPAGPDALAVTAVPAAVQSNEVVTFTATLNDTRYNNGNGAEPVQNVVDAEFYVDVPPWHTAGGPVAVPMLASDGGFDEPVEPVTGTASTGTLAEGRHIVFVRGRDAAGNWGAHSAAFFHVLPEPDADGDGVGNSADCAPDAAAVWRVPSPARNLTVDRAPADNLAWTPPADPGCLVPRYDVLRAATGADFTGATCVASDIEATSATDGAVPAAGELYAYLVRASNACGDTLGASSAGDPRTGASCP